MSEGYELQQPVPEFLVWGTNLITRELASAAQSGVGPDEGLPVVVHYSSPEGVLGILETGEIWATDVHFLNDQSEFSYAVDLFEDEVRRRIKKRELHKDWVKFIEKELVAMRERRTFVSCFSARRDDLSQWRAYGAQGVALGVSVSVLQGVADRLSNASAFAPLIYDLNKQASLIVDLIDRLVTEAPGESPPKSLRTAVVSLLTLLASFLKDPCFREEDEWRLVVWGDLAGEAAERVRCVGGILTPFVPVPIGPVKDFISCVWVGPGPDLQLSRSGIERALGHFGCPDVRVLESSIPYRGW